MDWTNIGRREGTRPDGRASLFLRSGHLGEMGGLELSSKLASIHPEMPILYMCGGELPRADPFRRVAFVRKPFEMTVLSTTINGLLEQNRSPAAAKPSGRIFSIMNITSILAALYRDLYNVSSAIYHVEELAELRHKRDERDVSSWKRISGTVKKRGHPRSAENSMHQALTWGFNRRRDSYPA